GVSRHTHSSRMTRHSSHPALDASCLIVLYVDLSAAPLRTFGQHHRQDAAINLRRDALDIDAFGESKSPLELAVSALQAVEVFAVGVALPPALAAQDQVAVDHFDIDLGALHARHLGRQDE